MKTHVTKESEIQRGWHVIDAEGAVLGRLACEAARLLRGKHKPNYSPHLDSGDHVIIVNAEKIVLTGSKREQKYHWNYSGFPSGMKITPYSRYLESHPEDVVRKAVKGMLPSTKLGRQMLRKVRIYTGAEHPHEAQNPTEFALKGKVAAE